MAKRIRKPKPWINYVFDCECGKKILYATQNDKVKQTKCGECNDNIASTGE